MPGQQNPSPGVKSIIECKRQPDHNAKSKNERPVKRPGHLDLQMVQVGQHTASAASDDNIPCIASQ